MNAADSRLILSFWAFGAVAVTCAVVAHHVWQDRREAKALAEYEAWRRERTARIQAAAMARDINRQRRCAANDEHARQQMQEAVARALAWRDQLLVDRFNDEMDRLTERGEL